MTSRDERVDRATGYVLRVAVSIGLALAGYAFLSLKEEVKALRSDMKEAFSGLDSRTRDLEKVGCERRLHDLEVASANNKK